MKIRSIKRGRFVTEIRCIDGAFAKLFKVVDGKILTAYPGTEASPLERLQIVEAVFDHSTQKK